MRRLVHLKTICTFALLLLVVFACKPTGSREPTNVKSADGKFQITVPDGWKSMGGTGTTNEIINSENSRLDLGVIVTAKKKSELDDGLTLDKYTELGRDAQVKDSNTKSVTQPEPVMFNGYEARQYEVTREKAICLITAIESPENFHRVTACGPAASYSDNKSTLKQISESFRAL
jgi:hypothetical protein